VKVFNPKWLLLHRALFTWFICLIFLILLVLRLDERTRWSWFIVFIPMWLYDSILIVYFAFEMITLCRASGGPGEQSVTRWRHVRRKGWYLTCAVMKLAMQIMICLKLDNRESGALDIPLYYIMIPLWIVLPVTIADLFFNNLLSVKVTRWLRNART